MSINIKMNLLGMNKDAEISGGSLNVIRLAQLSKYANQIPLAQIGLTELDANDTKSMLVATDKLSDVEITFVMKFVEMLKEVFKFSKKNADKVIEDTEIGDLLAFVNYVYGRLNGLSEEDLTEAPKEESLQKN